MSGAVSTNLECRGLKTKFVHLQRHSTARPHGCAESTMSSTSPVWHSLLSVLCTLPYWLRICLQHTVWSLRTYYRYCHLVTKSLLMFRKELAVMLFWPHFFTIWLLVIPFPGFIYTPHQLVREALFYPNNRRPSSDCFIKCFNIICNSEVSLKIKSINMSDFDLAERQKVIIPISDFF